MVYQYLLISGEKMLMLAELKGSVFWVFLRYGITVPNLILVGYVRQILGRGGQKAPLATS